jgi:signal transduction histidine kinase/CheY-like chemotaxis protein
MDENEHLKREISARKDAEEALQRVRDELAQVSAELSRAREQATAAASEKEDFLAALSHELRTPLNPVLLIASEAAENPTLPDNVRRDFATIAKNAELEARLIDDLLDLNRIARGKMSLDKRGFDLRPVLEDAIATIRPRIDAKKIELATTLDSRVHPVFGDSARLQQVFWTVLKSTVKFTPEGGRLRVETRLDDAKVQIVITFTGKGVVETDDDTGQVLELLSHGGQNGTPGARHAGGLGLGMAISCLLVELHRGTIRASSGGPEKGATFTVNLPLGATSSSTSSPPMSSSVDPFSKTADTRPRAKVLVVEDHEPTSTALERLLRRRSFDVTIAGSIAEALHAAGASKFDLVICDIGLPDGDGYSLMTTLTQQHGLVGIAVTGFGMQEDIARSQAAGFIGHITKPLSVRALEAALENAHSTGALKRSRPGA